jgi:serine/threonine protein kinase
MPACPSHEELRAYTLGYLSDASSDDVAAHLGSCPACQAELASFDGAEDTFVEQLRRPAPADPYRAESECQAAVARALAVLDRSSPADDRSNPSLCGTTLGEYRLIEQLGRGGMGTVYKALHTKLDRVVAIKVLALGRAQDQHAIARFEREMKAIGKLDHHHIVRAYDAREIDGTPTLVMEYTEGLDLGELVRRAGPLATGEACELARQAALGLQYVHEHGLVHRDIKPSNLMLTLQGEVKILDLGLARFHLDPPWDEARADSGRAVAPEMTATDQAVGTADYMAPEQVSNSPDVDIRADIYGLGCTLYKLLAGRAPFDGPEHKGPGEKMVAHTREPVPPIRQFCPDIPERLVAILDRMLAKDPEARYAVPAEVADALAPWGASADLTALLRRASDREAEPSGDRRTRPARAAQAARKPRPLLASSGRKWLVALLVLLLVGGLGFALGIIIHIKQGGQTTTIEAPTGSSVHIAADGHVNVEVPEQAKIAEDLKTENMFLAVELPDAKAGNYWAKYRLWAAYHNGSDGVQKNPAEARKWLNEVVKDAYLATFRPVHGFAPTTPQEFLANFSAHSSLRSEARGLGGASFFRTRVKDGRLIGSFLTEYPDKMRKAIAANPSLELISIEKVTPETFVPYEASSQESLPTVSNTILDTIEKLFQSGGKQQAKAQSRMACDQKTFSRQELQQIESLYQVANQKWQTQQARDALKALVQKYKKANRTGCAILYLGQMSQGDEKIAYFQQAIADYSDCFYGDGVQVGAYARFLLGQVYLESGSAEKANALFGEIRKDYPDSIDHNGGSLVDQLPQPSGAGKPTGSPGPTSESRPSGPPAGGDVPRIVATSPPSGATDVDPAVAEISVTFDRDMNPAGYAWTSGGADFPPKPEGKNMFWRDRRTCVWPVKLEPGHYYRAGINSQLYPYFRSAENVPVPPSAICFTTRGASMEMKNRAQGPRVIATSPPSGATDVDPATKEITVTFDRDMDTGIYSWVSGEADYPLYPPGKDSFWRDRRTCVHPVKLEAGHYYQIGINDPRYASFRSAEGIPAQSMTLDFTTRGATAAIKSRGPKPQIVSMNPPNGATDVDPKLGELRVTFNMPMRGGYAWCTSDESHYPTAGGAHWTEDHETCILPVTLKPGWDYRIELNAPSFEGFQSKAGIPLDPVQYTFTTRGDASGKGAAAPRIFAASLPKGVVRLSYVGDSSEDKRSLGGSGHAVLFDRPERAQSVVAVQLYASRYGLPEPPEEDFHVWLLDENRKVLQDFRFPYAKIVRGPMRWYTLSMPPTEVPKRFYVALSFNPEQTKGIYLGLDKKVKESHSSIGLPEGGFEPIGSPSDWMVRVWLTAPAQRGAVPQAAATSPPIGAASQPKKEIEHWDLSGAKTKRPAVVDKVAGGAGQPDVAKGTAAAVLAQGAEAPGDERHADARRNALQAAQAWLALIDQGKYAEGWDATAACYKNVVRKEDFAKPLGALRAPLGKMNSRELKSEQYAAQLPAAPDGQYVVIQFTTEFENKKSAVETVTPMLEKDGRWRVSGYYLK